MRLAVTTLALLTGCAGAVARTEDAGTPGNEASAPWSYTYVVDSQELTVGGTIVVFASPLSASSAPMLVLGTANGVSRPSAVRTDPSSTKIWVADGKHVLAFSLPLHESSQPTVTLVAKGFIGDIRFDSQGNLWVADLYGGIEGWAGPSPSGSPSFALATDTVIPNNAYPPVVALAADTKGRLYATDGCSVGVCSVSQFNTPTSGGPADVNDAPLEYGVRGLEIIGGTLYAAADRASAIYRLKLPLRTDVWKAPDLIGVTDYLARLAVSPTGGLVVAYGHGPIGVIEFRKRSDFTSIDFRLTHGLDTPIGVAFSP